MTLVQDCGGREINLNVMFEMGYATGRPDLALSPERWLEAYDEVIRRQGEFTIRIKVPPAFTAPRDIPRHRVDGHRCLAVDGSRVYVASNGDSYPCLAMMDDPGNRSGGFAGQTLPTRPRRGNRRRPVARCTTIDFIKMRSDGLKPLCIFHKTRLNTPVADRSQVQL